MEQNDKPREKKVFVIPATVSQEISTRLSKPQLRVAAYCRVSTKQEEQLNSYETQRSYYTNKISSEPNWKMVGIYADKGITGTSTKKRDEFNRLMRHCREGRVDMIITKSISRFARNTVDCLVYTRKLKEMNVDVFFEEQGIHSTQNGAEFYITIYGSIAQSESENISANVIWGRTESARKGNVSFQYKRMLGYQKGADGNPEIIPEQAEIVRRIYQEFLDGASMNTIAKRLQEDGVETVTGTGEWNSGTIKSILTNEKYMGDAIINKTYTVDCISKIVKKNNGERPKFYVEDNHPGIVEKSTFARVQEEIARRNSITKVKQVGTKTELGKYSSKYALSELLICGECGCHYRRCTWTIKGVKKIVWRCINRLDYGKKYCHHSPSVEEGSLEKAIMNAVFMMAIQNTGILETLKYYITMGVNEEPTAQDEESIMDIRIRIVQIDQEFKAMLDTIASDNVDQFDEARAAQLLKEKELLQTKLMLLKKNNEQSEANRERVQEILSTVDLLRNQPIEFNNVMVRKMIQSVVVLSKEEIKVVLLGGTEIVQSV